MFLFHKKPKKDKEPSQDYPIPVEAELRRIVKVESFDFTSNGNWEDDCPTFRGLKRERRLKSLKETGCLKRAGKKYVLTVIYEDSGRRLELTVRGACSEDDVKNFLGVNEQFYRFVEWPYDKERRESLMVCQMMDRTVILENWRAKMNNVGEPQCLYGCPDAKALDHLELKKVTEIIDYD